MKEHIIEIKKSKWIPVRSIVGYSVLAIISGLSGFAFITIINKIISMSLKTGLPESNMYLFFFLGTIAVFFTTRRWLSIGIINLSQKIFYNIRKDIVKLVVKAPYQKLKENKDEIYSTMTSDVHNIINASLVVITFFSSIVMILASFIYMAYLSLSLFGMSFGIIAGGAFIYWLRSRKSDAQFKIVRELENDFMNTFNGILDGTKEININRKKGSDIYEKKLLGIVDKAEKTNINAFIKYVNNEILGQLLFYILITFILIYGSRILQTPIEITISFVFVLLYILGPISSVMALVPVISKAKISLEKINKLKKELKIVEQAYDDKNQIDDLIFDSLSLKNYLFSYGKDKFAIGPVSLELKRNEIIFIHGGNGAGKTTFINTLLRLYNIHEGEAYINDQFIPDKDSSKVKSLFAPIFSDFYLFDDFYGIPNVDTEKVNYFLKLFELDKKVYLKDGKFSTIDVSTGQRKRLALIYALLEERPILVLDEWAADQDPYFRNKFYTEIIPEIVNQHDKTIIAITHDDKYYHTADRLYRMEYGQLKEINKTRPEIVEY